MPAPGPPRSEIRGRGAALGRRALSPSSLAAGSVHPAASGAPAQPPLTELQGLPSCGPVTRLGSGGWFGVAVPVPSSGGEGSAASRSEEDQGQVGVSSRRSRQSLRSVRLGHSRLPVTARLLCRHVPVPSLLLRSSRVQQPILSFPSSLLGWPDVPWQTGQETMVLSHVTRDIGSAWSHGAESKVLES